MLRAEHVEVAKANEPDVFCDSAGKRLLTANGAGRILGVSRTTLLKWLGTELLDGIERGPNRRPRVLIPEENVRQFAAHKAGRGAHNAQAEGEPPVVGIINALTAERDALRASVARLESEVAHLRVGIDELAEAQKSQIAAVKSLNRAGSGHSVKQTRAE